MVHIAEQREIHIDLFGPFGVRRRTIDADTQDLGIRSFQAFKVCLKGLHLLSSTAGEGENIERQRDILLSAIVAE